MSITDGTVICANCGEWMTSCALCRGEERTIDVSAKLARLAREEREAEIELAAQSRCIKDAASLGI